MGSRTYASTKNVDARSQVEQVSGQFAAPLSTVANPGAVAGSTGDYSQLTQNLHVEATGFSSDAVRQMMLDQQAVAAQNVAQVSQLSSRALEASSAVLGTLASAQTGEPADWTRYIPYAVVAVIIVGMTMRRRAA